MANEVTLITGGNKGLGFAAARRLVAAGHSVYIGSRDAERGRSAAEALDAKFLQLDVTDDSLVRRALAEVDEKEGRLDILINNAGIGDGPGIDGITSARAHEVFDTNAVGVVRVTQAALPLLHRSDNPVVVNVGSLLGSIWAVTSPDTPQSHVPFVVYAASKAALSMLTVQYAKAVPEVKFNAVEPGFTATDLTADFGGGRPIEESVDVIVQWATIGPDAPSGTFQDENGLLRW